MTVQAREHVMSVTWEPPIDIAEVDAYLRSMPSPPRADPVDPVHELRKLVEQIGLGKATMAELTSRARELTPPRGWPGGAWARAAELERWAYPRLVGMGVVGQ